MDYERALVFGTATVIIGAMLVSGPLVGISLTEEKAFAPGTGSADATVVSAPETATISEGSHGAGVYYIRVDPVQLDVAELSGQPSVAYKVSIPALNRTSMSITVLREPGVYSIEFGSSSIEAGRIDAESYEGTIQLTLFDSDGSEQLFETEVEIEVKNEE